MSTTTDYAQPRRIDWAAITDGALILVIMFCCGVVW